MRLRSIILLFTTITVLSLLFIGSCGGGGVKPVQEMGFSNPDPAHLAKQVSREVSFSWVFGNQARGNTAFNFYFGTDPSSLEKKNDQPFLENIFVLRGLEYSDTYFWQIAAITSDEETLGPIWQFTTVNQYSVSNYEAHQINGDSIVHIINQEGAIYASAEGGVYSLNESSSTWTKLYSGGPRKLGFYNGSLYFMAHDGIYRFENENPLFQYPYPTTFGQEDWHIWTFHDFLVDRGESFLATYGYHGGWHHYGELAKDGIGILYSADEGLTWTLLNEGLSNTNVTRLKLSRDGQVFCSTIGGLYQLDRETMRWQKLLDVSDAMGYKKIIEDFDFFYDTEGSVQKIFAVNQGSGIYVLDYPELTYDFFSYPKEGIVLSIYVDCISDYILTTHWIDGVYLWNRNTMEVISVFFDTTIWNTSGVILNGDTAITGAYGGYLSAFKKDIDTDTAVLINEGLSGRHNIRSAIKDNNTVYFGGTSGYIQREQGTDSFVVVTDEQHAVGEIMCMQKHPKNGRIYFQDVDNGVFMIDGDEVTQVQFTGTELLPGMDTRISAGLWFRFVDDLLFITNSKNPHLQFAVYQMDEQGLNGTFLYRAHGLPEFLYAFSVHFEIALPFIALTGPVETPHTSYLFGSEDGGQTFFVIDNNVNRSIALYNQYVYYLKNEKMYMYNFDTGDIYDIDIHASFTFSCYNLLITGIDDKIVVYTISELGEVEFYIEYVVPFPYIGFQYNLWEEGFAIIYEDIHFWDITQN